MPLFIDGNAKGVSARLSSRPKPTPIAHCPRAAVDRVTLGVPRRCVFALLGENGAGTTTLVGMMLGLFGPDAGALRVLGLGRFYRGCLRSIPA